jgi:UDP-4-amino-4,6-dideoxy-N-acetyl-beta-L-altrosamine N-acetyltransferase
MVNFIQTSEEQRRMILEWRNSDTIRMKMFETHIISWESHLSFIEGLKARSDCHYFLCSFENEYLGVANVTAISIAHSRANWGIYLSPECSVKLAGYKIAEAIFHFVFKTMGLQTLRSEVLANNQIGLLYNQSLGFEQEAVLKDYIIHPSMPIDLVILRMTRKAYEERERS